MASCRAFVVGGNYFALPAVEIKRRMLHFVVFVQLRIKELEDALEQERELRIRVSTE